MTYSQLQACKREEHLHACERIHGPSVALHPPVQALPLLHDDAWGHGVATGVHKRAVLIRNDVACFRQESTQRAGAISILCMLIMERSVGHEKLDCVVNLAEHVGGKLHNGLPCNTKKLC